MNALKTEKVSDSLDLFLPLGQTSSVIVVVHGLNLRPEKMGDIEQLLIGGGAAVLRLSLTGHRHDYQELRRATHEAWLQDASEAFAKARELGAILDVPIYFLGYSLGALIEMARVGRRRKEQYQRSLFLAMPLELTWLGGLYKSLRVLNRNLNIPSEGVKGYRMYNRVPLQAYEALYALHREVHKQYAIGKWKTPVLLFLDPHDELTHFEKTVLYLYQNTHPHEWLIVPMIKSTGFQFLRRNPHHLCIDRQSMGEVMWNRFAEHAWRHFMLGSSPDQAVADKP